MPVAPNEAVLEAFLGSVSRIFRRIEIFEFDGKTPWRPDVWNAFVDGGVSVDYSRDDRRNLDITLDNFDGELDHKPSNLWYDKVFKVFYGIEVNQKPRKPTIVIAEEYNAPGQAVALKKMLAANGFNKVTINTGVTTYDQVQKYDIVVSIAADYSRKLGMLTEAFNAGKSVLNFSLDTTAAQLPYLIGTAATATRTASGSTSPYSLSANPAAAHPAQLGWSGELYPPGPFTYRPVTAVAAGGVGYLRLYDGTAGAFSVGAIAREATSGARWGWMQHIDFATPSLADQLGQMVAALTGWSDSYEPIDKWETQIGEFVPETIATDADDDDLIKVTGRDYTKRCLESKLATATTYTIGQSIDTIITALASNSYCFKFAITPTGKTITKDVTYEADKTRWEIMKDIANTSGYEIFFNSMGFLVMRPYQDPLLTPPSFTLAAGEPYGNLVKISSTASDSRLKNQIVVKGESSDSTVLPVWAMSQNTTPNSPSAVNRIGARTETFSSPLYITVSQCKAMADSLLRVSSLEEFEISFEAILFPWLEVGEILVKDNSVGTSGTGEPDRFLISSLTFPLGELGPMSGSGKRVTIVV